MDSHSSQLPEGFPASKPLATGWVQAQAQLLSPAVVPALRAPRPPPPFEGRQMSFSKDSDQKAFFFNVLFPFPRAAIKVRTPPAARSVVQVLKLSQLPGAQTFTVGHKQPQWPSFATDNDFARVHPASVLGLGREDLGLRAEPRLGAEPWRGGGRGGA